MSAPARPRLLVVVVGTATDVGKTWVTARVVERLRVEGLSVGVRKPVQSYDPAVVDPTDAEVLGAASGEHPLTVCAQERSLPAAMAPPMAAEVLGRRASTIEDLVSEIRWFDTVDIGIVETIGGVRSPIASDGDSRDLAAALAPDATLLVGDAGLGVINSVRTSVDALAPLAPFVHLNRFVPTDDLHLRNREWLAARDGYDVTVDVDTLVARLATCHAERAVL